jgi:hypothetical protein
MLMPPGKFFTMFHFLEYPFSRGSTHITSANPYEAPDFDAGFMNVSFFAPIRSTTSFTNLYTGQEGYGAYDLELYQV